MIYLCSCFALTLPPSIIFSTILTSLPSSSSYNLSILYPSLLLTCSSPFFPPYFTPTLSIAFFQSLCPFLVLILPALHTLSYLLSPPHPSIKLSVQLATFPPPLCYSAHITFSFPFFLSLQWSHPTGFTFPFHFYIPQSHLTLPYPLSASHPFLSPPPKPSSTHFIFLVPPFSFVSSSLSENIIGTQCIDMKFNFQLNSPPRTDFTSGHMVHISCCFTHCSVKEC